MCTKQGPWNPVESIGIPWDPVRSGGIPGSRDSAPTAQGQLIKTTYQHTCRDKGSQQIVPKHSAPARSNNQGLAAVKNNTQA